MIGFLPCENVIYRTLSIKVSFWSDRLLADHGGDRLKLDYLKEYAVLAYGGSKTVCTFIYIKLTDFA